MRASIPDGVLVQQIENKSVLLNIESEIYFGLDDVGVEFWAALTTEQSVQRAFEVLLEMYDIDPMQLETDLTDFVEKLSQNGLLRIESEEHE